MSRAPAAVAAVLALSVTPAVAHPPGVCLPAQRCAAWTATYDDTAVPAGHRSEQYVRAVLANATTSFTVVRSVAFSTTDWRTSTATANVVAHDLVTGAVLWTSREAHDAFYAPEHAVLSPDGATLYVTGTAYDAHPFASTSERIVTTAHATATGATLWSATWDSGAASADNANGIAVAPDGSEVYVVGTTPTANGNWDVLTVAYDASGTELWSRTYDVAGGSDEPYDVAVSGDGAVLAVTGVTDSAGSLPDYVTVAYALRGTPGQQVWARTHDATGRSDAAHGIAADGDRFYVTGGSDGGPAGYEYATVAYDVVTGAQVWSARWSGGPDAFDVATEVAVADGRVVVTGRAIASSDGADFDAATVGYDAATGDELWSARFAPVRHDGYAAGLAISADGDTAYVVTRESFYLTTSLAPRLGLVAYDVATGAERWRAFLDEAGGSLGAAGVAVGGGAVAVAGDVSSAQRTVDALTAVFPG